MNNMNRTSSYTAGASGDLPDIPTTREFYEQIFKHALPLLSEGKLNYSFRVFGLNHGGTPAAIETIPWKTDAVDDYLRGLEQRFDKHRASVIAPPVALFEGTSAKLKDLACGVCIFIDADTDPSATIAKARSILGEPTIVVASGSYWADEKTGISEPKLHAYWRLNKPTKSKPEHDKLIETFRLLVKITGGDPSTTAVHPMGLPGSINPKNGLVRKIVERHHHSEIDLDVALAALREANAKSSDSGTRNDAKGKGGAAEDFAEGATGKIGLDVEACVTAIIKGQHMHPNVVPLVAHYVAKGMSRADVKDTLRGLVGASCRDEQRKKVLLGRELDAAIESAFEKFGAEQAEAETPARLTGGNPYCTDFPVAELPEEMRVAVEAAAAATATPVTYAALVALASVSASVSYLADVQTLAPKPAPVSLYVLNIAETGTRKTAVDNLFREPFDRIERSRRKQYEAYCDFYKLERAQYDAAFSKAAKSGGPIGLKPVPPIVPAIVLSDLTFEALVRNMQGAGPMAVIWSAEAGMIFGGAGFSPERAQTAVSTLNLAWDGQDIVRARVGGAGGESAKLQDIAVRIVAPRLTANLQIHPPLAQGIVSSDMMSSQGLAARLLLAYADPGLGSRPRGRSTPELQQRIDTFNARIEELLILSIKNAEKAHRYSKSNRGEDEDAELDDPFQDPQTLNDRMTGFSGLGLPVLSLSQGAEMALEAFDREIEPQLGKGGKLETLLGVGSKACEQAGRIAACLTLYSDEKAVEISEVEMKSAIAIMRWFLDARLRFEWASANADYEVATRLVEWIKANVYDGYVGSGFLLRNAPIRALRNKGYLHRIADLLVEAYWFIPMTAAEVSAGVKAHGETVRKGWRLHPSFRAAKV